MEKLKENREWSSSISDFMMNGIAFTLSKNILVINTKPQDLSKEAITLIQPETFDGETNTDIPLVLAYDGSHYEGFIPNDEEDIQKTIELVRKMKTNNYHVKTGDIEVLRDIVNLKGNT